MNNSNQIISPSDSSSGWKKDIGDSWLLTIGFVLVAVQFILPLFFWMFTYLVAFLLGVISLMRSIKKRQSWLIFASIILMIIPILLVFWLRFANS